MTNSIKFGVGAIDLSGTPIANLLELDTLDPAATTETQWLFDPRMIDSWDERGLTMPANGAAMGAAGLFDLGFDRGISLVPTGSGTYPKAAADGLLFASGQRYATVRQAGMPDSNVDNPHVEGFVDWSLFIKIRLGNRNQGYAPIRRGNQIAIDYSGGGYLIDATTGTSINGGAGLAANGIIAMLFAFHYDVAANTTQTRLWVDGVLSATYAGQPPKVISQNQDGRTSTLGGSGAGTFDGTIIRARRDYLRNGVTPEIILALEAAA